MGVMNCQRQDCNNILCNRYSYTYGYICNECFLELVGSGIEIDIAGFMFSSKYGIKDTIEEPFEKFNREFPVHE